MASSLCAVLDLSGHVHHDSCGHPMVAHGDHSDYLVDGELHHVSSSCCSRGCIQGPVVVSHGRLTSLQQRRPHGLEHVALLGAAAPPAVSPPPGLAPAPQQRTTRIYAQGICCPMEVPLVHSLLDGMPGVEHVAVAVVSQNVVVRHDAARASPAVLVAALNSAMLDASLTPPRAQAQVRGRWWPPWYVVGGALLLAVSLLHYLSGPTGVAWLENFKYIALGGVALCLPRCALRAALALRRGIVDIHLLVTLAAAGAIALGDYGEAAATVVLFAVAEHWERASADRARGAVEAVLSLRPETAKLACSGATVPVEDVAPGTEVLVLPGETVPLDGCILDGESALDESLLTGESAPVLHGPGATVHAGTLNAGAAVLRVRTTAAAEDSAVARMARMVEAAAAQQSPAEALVARFARIYTPLVLVACALVAFLPWAWTSDGQERQDWVYLSLQILVTACPCALVLATPATVVCALARAAQHGVLIKSGAALEALRRVEVVTFDKTGTLTKGQFQVVGAQACGGWSAAGLLRLLGSLERGSSHPLAAAVLGYAAGQGVACDAAVEGAVLVPGAGLTATVDGHAVAAGTASLLASAAGVAGPDVVAAARVIDAEGATACFVAVDGQLAGWISARDVVRPEAAEAVAMVARLGCTAAMLTGDAAAAAAGAGAAVGIPPPRVHAQLSPQQKLDQVAEYQQGVAPRRPTSAAAGCCGGALPSAACCLRPRRGGQPRPRRAWLAHVGDGVNDAPALAAADVGVAMGVAGSAAALDAGSVALFTNDLRAVPAALMLARSAGRIIFANIAFAVCTKVAVLVPAIMGQFTLWGAVLVDVGSALLVMANALRLLKWRWPVDTAAHAHGAKKAPLAHSHSRSHGGDCCAKAKPSCCSSHGGTEPPTHSHGGGGCTKSSGCNSHGITEPHTHSHSSGCCAKAEPSCGGSDGGTEPHAHSHGGGCCTKAEPSCSQAGTHSHSGGCCSKSKPSCGSHGGAEPLAPIQSGACCAKKTNGSCSTSLCGVAEAPTHDHSVGCCSHSGRS